MVSTYLDFTEDEIEVMENLGFEVGLNVIELKNQHKDKPDYCVSCGEKFSNKNVFTKVGWKETEISGICEKCWDGVF